MLTEYTITVTETHVTRAQRIRDRQQSCFSPMRSCPVSLAFADAGYLPDGECLVTKTEMRHNTDTGTVDHGCFLTPELQAVVNAFDDRLPMPALPITATMPYVDDLRAAHTNALCQEVTP